MNLFSYADQRFGKKEMVINIASITIAVGILTFPRALARETGSADGWISIMLSGGLAFVLGWLLGTLAARFPRHTFYEYASLIVSKPVAILLTLSIVLHVLLFVAYEVRAVGNIAKQYLFTQTPVEVINLSFLLILQYALFGSRVALYRLNYIFLPIVLFVIVMVQLAGLAYFEPENLKPHFTTEWPALLKGAKEVSFSFTGFEIILFHGAFMKRPEQAPKAVFIGLMIPFLLYLTIYLLAVGVFSVEATQNMTYPTIELAKEVEVPGGFFERIEAAFFTIWLMTIFNTGAMYFDIALLGLRSLFRNVKKSTWIIVLSPIIYFIAMLPQNLSEFFRFGDLITYFGGTVAIFLPILLLFIAILRGVKGDD